MPAIASFANVPRDALGAAIPRPMKLRNASVNTASESVRLALPLLILYN